MTLLHLIVLWLLIGVAAGWLGSLLMGTGSQQGTFLDTGAGILGALLAGGFVHRYFSVSLGEDTLVVSIGAAVVCASVSLLLWRSFAAREVPRRPQP